MGLELTVLLPDFDQHLRAKGRAERTRYLYRSAAERFIAWAKAEGLDLDVEKIDNRVLERYFVDLGQEVNDTTTAMHYRSLRTLWSWIEREDEIDKSPFRRMSEPKVEDRPPEIIRPDQMSRLLDSMKGRDFTDRRDRALCFVLYDTGARLGELVGMAMADIDDQYRVVYLDGKTGPRAAPLGDAALEALNRYRRARRDHPHAERPELWLGARGPLKATGVAQLLKRRRAAVDMPGLRPHLFRHSMAHAWLAAGGQDSDLQLIAGWRSPEMVRRYGRRAIGGGRDAFDLARELLVLEGYIDDGAQGERRLMKHFSIRPYRAINDRKSPSYDPAAPRPGTPVWGGRTDRL